MIVLISIARLTGTQDYLINGELSKSEIDRNIEITLGIHRKGI